MALLMYKSIHGLAPNYLCNEITMEIEVSNRTSRHINENDVHMPNAYLEITKNAFSCKGPYVWNKLPNYIKECTSLTSFKMKAKKHFTNSCDATWWWCFYMYILSSMYCAYICTVTWHYNMCKHCEIVGESQHLSRNCNCLWQYRFPLRRVFLGGGW